MQGDARRAEITGQARPPLTGQAHPAWRHFSLSDVPLKISLLWGRCVLLGSRACCAWVLPIMIVMGVALYALQPCPPTHWSLPSAPLSTVSRSEQFVRVIAAPPRALHPRA